MILFLDDFPDPLPIRQTESEWKGHCPEEEASSVSDGRMALFSSTVNEWLTD